MGKAPIIILEGTWWSSHEVPLVLPYFQALSISHEQIDLSHRTIRNADDIGFYVSKIRKGAGAFLYFACHGDNLSLKPSGDRSRIKRQDLLQALAQAKEGAVSFIHFGCCEMIDPNLRRSSHLEVLAAIGAKWCSGYTISVDWLPSMFLDLALISEVFVPQHSVKDGRKGRIRHRASHFVKSYEQLARELGFSAFFQSSNAGSLFPKRLRS